MEVPNSKYLAKNSRARCASNFGTTCERRIDAVTNMMLAHESSDGLPNPKYLAKLSCTRCASDFQTAYRRCADALKNMMLAYKFSDGRHTKATDWALTSFFLCNDVENFKREAIGLISLLEGSNATHLISPLMSTTVVERQFAELLEYLESDDLDWIGAHVTEVCNSTGNGHASDETVDHNMAEKAAAALHILLDSEENGSPWFSVLTTLL